MTLIDGHKLTDAQRADVLAAFVHRWTSDNPNRPRVYGRCPNCGDRAGLEPPAPRCAGYHPTLPLSTDKEWVDSHAFFFRKDGRLSRSHRYAWPNTAGGRKEAR